MSDPMSDQIAVTAERLCEQCEEPIVDKRSDAEFCTNACRARHRRVRLIAERRIQSAITALERLADVATRDDWSAFEDRLEALADRVVASRTTGDTTDSGGVG